MDNLDARSYAPAYRGKNSDAGMSDISLAGFGGRLKGQLPDEVSDNIPAETQELINREIARQLRQLEPVYKVIHGLRQEVSKALLDGMRIENSQNFGFISESDDLINILPLIHKIQFGVKCLNACYEDMQGMASDLTVGLRRISLNLQTQLLAVVLRFKEYSGGGDMDSSVRSQYLSDLENLHLILGNDEINLEALRGRIGN